VPDITDILINGLEQITITENEVEDILKILDTGKYTNEGNWSVVLQISGTIFFKNGGHISIFPF
jgi:hypothetical protein